MPELKYRLQPLLDHKNRLKEQAEEVLVQKQTQLQLAAEKLEQLHASELALAAKKQTLRRNLLSGDERAISGVEIRRRREHLECVHLELEAAKDAVFAQQLFIDDCKQQVDEARQHLVKCSHDVEILKKHKEKLERRFQREADRKQAQELDEIGNMLYVGRIQRQ